MTSFPFTADRKRETGIVREDGLLIAAMKGAPEVVLVCCDLGMADAREAGKLASTTSQAPRTR